MIKRSPQEIADFFGCYVAMDKDGEWMFYHEKPELSLEKKMWIDGGVSTRAPNEAFLEVAAYHCWTTLYEPKPLSEKADSDNYEGDLYKEVRDPIKVFNAIRAKTGISAKSYCPDFKDSGSKDSAPHQSQVHVHQEYDVIYAEYPERLSIEVTQLIHEGWKPVGGIVCLPPAHREDSETFYQAMVRGLE